MIRYKVLNANMTTPFQNFKMSLGEKYICEDFNTDKTQDCAAGFYATDLEGLPYSFRQGRKIFRCNVGGKRVEIPPYKMRYEKFELLEEVTLEETGECAKKIESDIGYRLSEVLNPMNPLTMNPVVSDHHIELLKVWDSVWDSVGNSVWDSVGNSVGNSVWNSVWAYSGSLFNNIESWKYINHKKGEYPFDSGNKLWRAGLIPVKIKDEWCLLGGPKMAILWRGKL